MSARHRSAFESFRNVERARARILLSLVLFLSLVRTRSAEAEHIVKERSNFSLRPRYFCRWQLYTRIHLLRHDPRDLATRFFPLAQECDFR